MLNPEEENKPLPASAASPPGITREELIAHIAAEAEKVALQPPQHEDGRKGLLILHTGNDWMKKASLEPDPRMLFGEFWHEGELCILFADTNLGKSILAVQIGDSISRGEAVSPFNFDCEPKKVLYLDFELSKKQFQNRYKNAPDEQYEWSPSFLRAEMDPDTELPEGANGFEEYLNLSLEQAVVESAIKVLIIDNLTYLRNETEQAKDALPLMKHLKRMKSKYELSILALAHTPKRDPTKSISRNDLQGSKMLMNFCDSAFSIGQSQKDNNLRYLKQIKQRATEERYGNDKVCLFMITKPDMFLKFEFVDFAREQEHLRELTDEDKDALRTAALTLKNQGRSFSQIADELQISRSKVVRLIESAR